MIKKNQTNKSDKHFKKIANNDHISEQKSNGLSDESIKLPAASNDSPA